ncbi:unnamed protein product, partial [Staurois parvus]
MAGRGRFQAWGVFSDRQAVSPIGLGPQPSSLRDWTADWRLGQQAATYHWAGASGNRRQSTTGQGPRAKSGNLPLGRASGNRRQPTTGQGPRATGSNLPLGRGLGQQVAIYPWAGAWATGSNLPLGRGLGQQAATYHWAGASGNRWQPTTGQGPRATGGNL